MLVVTSVVSVDVDAGVVVVVMVVSVVEGSGVVVCTDEVDTVVSETVTNNSNSKVWVRITKAMYNTVTENCRKSKTIISSQVLMHGFFF